MRITNIQKKELADIFKKHNLNLFDFEVSGGFEEFKIKFKGDYFSFTIIKMKTDEYAMIVLSVSNTQPLSYAGNWETVKSKFSGWSKKLDDELNTETGWESFETFNFLNNEYRDLENNFSNSEKLQIKRNIDDLKNKITQLNLPLENLKIIENKLDNLYIAVEELSKFDWKSQFIGTIASLIMSLIIPPELSGIIWTYIKSSFSGLTIES